MPSYDFGRMRQTYSDDEILDALKTQDQSYDWGRLAGSGYSAKEIIDALATQEQPDIRPMEMSTPLVRESNVLQSKPVLPEQQSPDMDLLNREGFMSAQSDLVRRQREAARARVPEMTNPRGFTPMDLGTLDPVPTVQMDTMPAIARSAASGGLQTVGGLAEAFAINPQMSEWGRDLQSVGDLKAQQALLGNEKRGFWGGGSVQAAQSAIPMAGAAAGAWLGGPVGYISAGALPMFGQIYAGAGGKTEGDRRLSATVQTAIEQGFDIPEALAFAATKWPGWLRVPLGLAINWITELGEEGAQKAAATWIEEGRNPQAEEIWSEVKGAVPAVTVMTGLLAGPGAVMGKGALPSRADVFNHALQEEIRLSPGNLFTDEVRDVHRATVTPQQRPGVAEIKAGMERSAQAYPGMTIPMEAEPQYLPENQFTGEIAMPEAERGGLRPDTNEVMVQGMPPQPEVEQLDVSTRTDEQIAWLTEHGRPGWKEAAAQEAERRGIGMQAQPAPETAQAVVQPKAQRPTRLTPIVDDRIAANADDLRAMAGQTGWAERGGHIIREIEDVNDIGYNNVVGRTKWIPNAEWFPELPEKLSGKAALDAVEKAIQGQPMSINEKRFVNGLLDIAEPRRQVQAENAADAQAEREAIIQADVAIQGVSNDELDALLDAAFNEERTPNAILTDQEIDELFGIPPGAEASQPGGQDAGIDEGSRPAGAFALEGHTPEDLKSVQQDVEGYSNETQGLQGREQTPDDGRGIPYRGGRGTLLGTAVPQDFQAGKGGALVGTEVRSAQDLAQAAQYLRDPRYETLRIFFVKDGKVVFHSGLSSREPGAVRFVGDMARHIKDRMAMVGADGYWLLHNHPSGKPDPSMADLNMTELVASAVPGFQGHVVIDHNQAAHIRLSPENGIADAVFMDVQSQDWTGGVSHNALGTPLMRPAHVIAVGKMLTLTRDQFVLIARNARGEINAIAEFPKTEAQRPARLKALIRRFARDSGAPEIIAVTNGPAAAELGMMRSQGYLLGVYHTGNNWTLADKSPNPKASMWGRGANVAEQDVEPYRPTESEELAKKFAFAVTGAAKSHLQPQVQQALEAAEEDWILAKRGVVPHAESQSRSEALAARLGWGAEDVAAVLDQAVTEGTPPVEVLGAAIAMSRIRAVDLLEAKTPDEFVGTVKDVLHIMTAARAYASELGRGLGYLGWLERSGGYQQPQGQGEKTQPRPIAGPSGRIAEGKAAAKQAAKAAEDVLTNAEERAKVAEFNRKNTAVGDASLREQEYQEQIAALEADLKTVDARLESARKARDAARAKMVENRQRMAKAAAGIKAANESRTKHEAKTPDDSVVAAAEVALKKAQADREVAWNKLVEARRLLKRATDMRLVAQGQTQKHETRAQRMEASTKANVGAALTENSIREALGGDKGIRIVMQALHRQGNDIDWHAVVGYLSGMANSIAKEAADKRTLPNLLMAMHVELWRANILTGLFTHEVNVTSNAANMLLEFALLNPLKEALPGGVGLRGYAKALGEMGGYRKVLADIWALMKYNAFEETPARRLAQVIETTDPELLALMKGSAGTKWADSHRKFIPGKAGKVIRGAGFVPLGIEDAIFKVIPYRYEMARQEQAGEARNVTKAIDYANKLTFQQSTGMLGMAVEKMHAKVPYTEFWVTFVKTMTNLIRRAADLTPGLTQVKNWQELQGKEGNEVMREAWALTILSTGLASVLLALMGDDDDEFQISGYAPMGRHAKLLWLEEHDNIGVRVGEDIYPLYRLSPLAEPAGMVIGMKNSIKQESAAPFVSSMFQAVLTKHFMAKIVDLYEGLMDVARAEGAKKAVEVSGRVARRQLGGIATGTVMPNFVAQLADMTDPYKRETKTLLDDLQKRVPGLREQLPPKLRVSGKVLEESRYQSPFPIQSRKAKKDEVTRWLMKLGRGIESEPRSIKDLPHDVRQELLKERWDYLRDAYEYTKGADEDVQLDAIDRALNGWGAYAKNVRLMGQAE